MHCIFRKNYFSSVQHFNKQLFQYKNPVNNIKLSRKIHESSCFNVKMYFEFENSYAYNIMERQGYAQKLFDNNVTRINDNTLSEDEFNNLVIRNWKDIDLQDLIDTFGKLGDYAMSKGLCISNKIFDHFVDELTDSLKHASDDQLLQVFDYVLKWPETASIRTRNYIEIWTALDDVCYAKMPTWSDDQYLQFIAKFFQLNTTKASDFCRKTLNKLATKSHRLNSGQIVKTLFFIGIIRVAPFDMHNLEVQLEKYMDELTVEELSIAAMGFFKTKKPIRNMDIINKMIDKIIESSKTIHEVSLAALLKVIRYSIQITLDEKIENLLEVLKHEVPRLSVMCCVHIALLGTATLTFHKECLDEIAKVTLQNSDKLRTKDIERLVFTFGTLNHKPSSENFFQMVLDELRKPEREAEIKKHGRSFISCISFLGMFDIHSKDLIHKALDPSFLQNCFGKAVYDYSREVLVLHNRVIVYFPDSDINRLSEKAAYLLAKRYTDYIPEETTKRTLNYAERMIVDILNTLRRIRGGPDYVTGDHILTSYQRGDLIVCNDKSGNPLPVSRFPKSMFGQVIKPPDDNEWMVLIIVGRNAIIKKHNAVIGLFESKARELRTLGYKVGMVKWNEWSQLIDTSEKINYLENVIHNVQSDLFNQM